MYNGELHSSLMSLLSVMTKNEVETVSVFASSCKKQLESAISKEDQSKYAGKKICIEEMSIAEIRTFWENSKS